MSDDSPFGDFSSTPSQPATFDEDTPIALPPPTDLPLEDAFGLSSAPSVSSDDDDGGASSEPIQSESSPAEPIPMASEDDPFASVDGGINSNNFDSFSKQQEGTQEDEPLKVWENQRAQVLRDRSTKAETDKQQLLSTAREEVAKFYAERDANIAKTQKTNRGDEKNYRSDMKSTFESGARWEKVNKLISTAPRPGEKAGTSRVERMRKLLIQLKVEKKQ